MGLAAGLGSAIQGGVRGFQQGEQIRRQRQQEKRASQEHALNQRAREQQLRLGRRQEERAQETHDLQTRLSELEVQGAERARQAERVLQGWTASGGQNLGEFRDLHNSMVSEDRQITDIERTDDGEIRTINAQGDEATYSPDEIGQTIAMMADPEAAASELASQETGTHAFRHPELGWVNVNEDGTLEPIEPGAGASLSGGDSGASRERILDDATMNALRRERAAAFPMPDDITMMQPGERERVTEARQTARRRTLDLVRAGVQPAPANQLAIEATRAEQDRMDEALEQARREAEEGELQVEAGSGVFGSGNISEDNPAIQERAQEIVQENPPEALAQYQQTLTGQANTAGNSAGLRLGESRGVTGAAQNASGLISGSPGEGSPLNNDRVPVPPRPPRLGRQDQRDDAQSAEQPPTERDEPPAGVGPGLNRPETTRSGQQVSPEEQAASLTEEASQIDLPEANREARLRPVRQRGMDSGASSRRGPDFVRFSEDRMQARQNGPVADFIQAVRNGERPSREAVGRAAQAVVSGSGRSALTDGELQRLIAFAQEYRSQ